MHMGSDIRENISDYYETTLSWVPSASVGATLYLIVDSYLVCILEQTKGKIATSEIRGRPRRGAPPARRRATMSIATPLFASCSDNDGKMFSTCGDGVDSGVWGQ